MSGMLLTPMPMTVTRRPLSSDRYSLMVDITSPPSIPFQ